MHTLRVILAILCFSLWVQETSAEFDATQLQTSIQKTIDAVKPVVVAVPDRDPIQRSDRESRRARAVCWSCRQSGNTLPGDSS